MLTAGQELMALQAIAGIAARMNVVTQEWKRPAGLEERIRGGWYVSLVVEGTHRLCAADWTAEAGSQGVRLPAVCGGEGRVQFDPGGAPEPWIPTAVACRDCMRAVWRSAAP